ncbi:MAG: DUF983 domain-containing protein [Salibacteraceae bacterium]
MRIIPKGILLRPILLHKCPKCHEGDLFTHPNPFHINGYFDQPELCHHCGQKFEIEPGFYYGAMYVNYGASIAISVAVFVAMYVLGSPWEPIDYIVGVGLALFLMSPYTFRSGRSIWLTIFVPYESNPEKWPKNSAKKVEQPK